MEKGMNIHHFRVERIREVPELNGSLIEMVHEKTGARLVWLNNGEKNKTFSIAFRTLPENSTGVFHILEHSVLCGSAKYPVREPFLELAKSSLNTFLNAMTFSDKTMYPISSRNDRDFLNLTEVYLDAVFAPNILTDPNIFRQEGWHIEQEKDGSLSYKGVVFNEMKGALGDVDDLIEERMSQLIFPDTSYGFISGGDPECIPDLSWEQFVATYKKYYHPSNAWIYLDGAIPREETFALLDSYLDRFERQNAVPFGDMQKPVAVEKTQYYELGREEELADRGRLSVGKILCGWDEKVKQWAASILMEVLLGTNEAPLKRAVLDAGLAQDISCSLMEGIRQPTFVMNVENLKDGKEAEVLALIRETVSGLLKKGLDREELEATLNRFEFRVREPSEPQGIERAVMMMQSSLFDGDPIRYLVNDDDLKELRGWLKTDGFEALCREMFLDDGDVCVLHTLPSYTIGDEKRAAEAERLQKIRASWSEEDLIRNNAENAALTAWQQTPDTEAQLNTLPRLTIAEASAEQPFYAPTAVSEMNGVEVLYHELPCHGVYYVQMCFRMTELSLEDMTKVSGIASLYGHLPTVKHDARSLERLLKKLTGSFSVSVSGTARYNDRKNCTPCLNVRFSVLKENLAETFALVDEILKETDFTKKESIRETVMQNEMISRQMGTQAGHQIGLLAAGSHSSAAGALSEAIEGYTMLQYLHRLSADFDSGWEEFSTLLTGVRDHTVCRARMSVSVTADALPDLAALINGLPEGTSVPENRAYSIDLPSKLGLRIPAQVGFGVQTCNIEDLGGSFCGSLQVLSNILTYSYFWNVVRVQGGAYGAGLRVRKGGLVITYTYRDPTPVKSVEANRGIQKAIRNFVSGDERLDGYIISTLNETDPLVTSREMGMIADAWYHSGWNAEKEKAVREEILSTTNEDLLKLAEILDAFGEKGAVCIVAPGEKMTGCDGLEIREL